MIDENKWYTLGQASKAIGGLYSVGQLRTRCKLGQIKHEVNPPLKVGGRVTYKVRGDEVLRLYGAALTAGQPRERTEPISVRLKRCREQSVRLLNSPK